MKTKLCKGCNQELALEKFSTSKIIKDGYENKCRDCRNAQRKKNNIKKCECCNKVFTSAKKDNKFCSKECSGIARRNRVLIPCAWCNKDVEVTESKSNGNVYCSSECKSKKISQQFKSSNNPNYKRVKTKCSGCDKEILVTPSRLEKQKYIFCSNECYKNNIGNYRVGELNTQYKRVLKKCSNCNCEIIRTPSSFTGERQFCSKECKNVFLKDMNESLSKKARVERACEYCGKKTIRKRSAFNGKRFTFCSTTCKNKHLSEYYVGANHPLYDPNITMMERTLKRNYAEYRVWRKKVYERDNYTCQCCRDDKGGNLVAHHIVNYSSNKDKRTELSNGITLCETCHKSFHSQYGYRNNTKDQLETYLNNNMLISSQD